jgi:hypothetical protein
VTEVDSVTKQHSLDEHASIKRRSSSLERASSKLTSQSSKKRDSSSAGTSPNAAAGNSAFYYRGLQLSTASVNDAMNPDQVKKKSSRERGSGATPSPKINRNSASLPPLPTIPIIDISSPPGIYCKRLISISFYLCFFLSFFFFFLKSLVND